MSDICYLLFSIGTELTVSWLNGHVKKKEENVV